MLPAVAVGAAALVRYRVNDYSVPATYGFRDVPVKGFVNQVAILCGAVEIARHPRAAKSPYKIIQKELDFAWERSVTAPVLAESEGLSGSCPAGFSACAGLRW